MVNSFRGTMRIEFPRPLGYLGLKNSCLYGCGSRCVYLGIAQKHKTYNLGQNICTKGYCETLQKSTQRFSENFKIFSKAKAFTLENFD